MATNRCSIRRVGAKHSFIVSNIETLCFREKCELQVFEFKNRGDCSMNVTYAPVNQNIIANDCLVVEFNLFIWREACYCSVKF